VKVSRKKFRGLKAMYFFGDLRTYWILFSTIGIKKKKPKRIRNNFVYNLHAGIAFLLRFTDLIRIPSPLLDKVVAGIC
jgi:hypothetical protein